MPEAPPADSAISLERIVRGNGTRHALWDDKRTRDNLAIVFHMSDCTISRHHGRGEDAVSGQRHFSIQ